MADTEEWIVDEKNIFMRIGTIQSNNIAVFSIRNTLMWDIDGVSAVIRRWVTSVRLETMVKVFNELLEDNWTIIFIDEVRSKMVEMSIDHVEEFLQAIQSVIPGFKPFVFIASYKKYHNRYDQVWDRFKTYSGLTPSEASFYCGTSIKQHQEHHLTVMNLDRSGANKMNLPFYEFKDILGRYSWSLGINNRDPIVMMAADPRQYDSLMNHLLEPDYSLYVGTPLEDVKEVIRDGGIPIITDAPVATAEDRQRLLNHFPDTIRRVKLLLFTRPVIEHASMLEIQAIKTRYYVQNLDLDLKTAYHAIEGKIEILRIN